MLCPLHSLTRYGDGRLGERGRSDGQSRSRGSFRLPGRLYSLRKTLSLGPFMAITIAEIEVGSSAFDQAIQLGTANAETLGFLPTAAFENHANRGWLIGAFDQPGEVVGYALYRIARGRAALAHLCVADTARGQGVARRLFDALTARTRQLRGIVVHCRRDYGLDGLWQSLGFAPIRDLAGRGSPPA